MEKAVTSEVCRACGGCCRDFPFVELSDGDVERLRAFTGLPESAFADSDRALAPRRFLRFQEDGRCLFLRDEAGLAACSVYEARPEICRSYPFTASQVRECSATWRKRLGAQ